MLQVRLGTDTDPGGGRGVHSLPHTSCSRENRLLGLVKPLQMCGKEPTAGLRLLSLEKPAYKAGPRLRGAPLSPRQPSPHNPPQRLTVHDGLDLILGPQEQGLPRECGAGEEAVAQGWILQGLEEGPRGARLPFPEGAPLGQGQVQSEVLGSGVQHTAGTVGPMILLHILEQEGLVPGHHPGLCGDFVRRHEADGQLPGALGCSREQLLQGFVALRAGEGAEVACGAQQKVSRWDRPLWVQGHTYQGRREQSESPEDKSQASGHPGHRVEGQAAASDHV